MATAQPAMGVLDSDIYKKKIIKKKMRVEKFQFDKHKINQN